MNENTMENKDNQSKMGNVKAERSKLFEKQKQRIQPVDQEFLENFPLPITQKAIDCVPTIAWLCHIYDLIIQNNYRNDVLKDNESMAKRLNLERRDFTQLLKSMNARCSDDEAYLFFDYLLN